MPSVEDVNSQILLRPRRRRHVALAIMLLLALLGGVLNAALTPAGTIIRNHAVIQFQRMDDSGRLYDAPSNEVLIEVLPVYNIEILPDGDAPPGTPGQILRAVSTTPNTRVVINYSLKFTGNAADNARIAPVFIHGSSNYLPKLADGDTGMLVIKDGNADGVVDNDDIQVGSWRDANGNGQVEAGELQIGDLGCQYQPGDIVNLLLVFRVPAGAAPGASSYMGIEGASVGDPTATDPISPLVSQNISQVLIVDDAVMTVTKAANVTEAIPGGVITYTVTGNSVGSAPALRRVLTVDGTLNSHQGVVLFDIIPTVSGSGLPLPISNAAIASQPPGVNGTIIYSSQNNTALDVSDPSWNWHSAYVNGDTVIAYVSSDGSGGNHDLPVGAAISFTFDGTVPAGTTDQALINVAYASYDTNALGIQTVKAINDVVVFVRGQTGVIIRDTDFELSPPPLTPADDGGSLSNDSQAVALAQAGTFVYFTNRVLNTGSGTDSFNITLRTTGGAPLTSNPNGWTFSFFKSDGVTPLRDTGSDGVIDTGPLPPSGTDLANPLHYADIVIRVEIPENAIASGNDPELLLVLQASSVLNPTQSDTTENIVVAVSAPTMALSNHLPPGSLTPDPTPFQFSGAPGDVLDYPLIVQNLAPLNGEADTYTLSTTAAPAGWKVSYFRDLNQNGQLDANELLPVLRTATVPPGGRDYLIARVMIPADAIADANADTVQDVHTLIFRATSTNLSSVFAEQDNRAMVMWQDRFELRPNRQGTIEAGSVTVYEHAVTNFGERGNRFYLTLTPGTPAWNHQIQTSDGSANLPRAIDPSDGTEKYYLDLAKAGAPGSTGNFRLRIYAPGSIPQGTVDVTAIGVSANDPAAPAMRLAATPMHIVTDVTFVVAGDLALTKNSDPAPGASVLPGQQIIYTTTFFNKSATGLAQLTIQDQIPSHTAYVLQSANVTMPLPAGLTGVSFEVSRNGGISWSADNVGAGNDPSVTNVRAVFIGSLAGGAEGDFIFSVVVR
ncbi:hypothetical protein [Oligosphaera ethanolica]|uniref:Repeat protein (TIGR01451 family) n=1 Tax=Oligosphaera ethanolica TaxID=760260 RepID=A0AAE3VF93_9BACT|nr:hypothetical protein [Oligosphaera ethanolica]MDQ0289412.1 putative repeat protein (TIGR01451 family) [Oligosphaera ethanolica]